jgi:hypothetical protein
VRIQASRNPLSAARAALRQSPMETEPNAKTTYEINNTWRTPVRGVRSLTSAAAPPQFSPSPCPTKSTVCRTVAIARADAGQSQVRLEQIVITRSPIATVADAEGLSVALRSNTRSDGKSEAINLRLAPPTDRAPDPFRAGARREGKSRRVSSQLPGVRKRRRSRLWPNFANALSHRLGPFEAPR